ncbi:MAG: leucine-rich repeat domain-containing protein [Candidatus Poribacteria bacterium]|nr:leucine-rich repeat domain-containing protein [Candidatus Poribacteria bacterium]
MKTLVVNRNIIASIFTTMFLICSVQGISYAQDDVLPGDEGTLFSVGETLVVTPGETNTSLKVSFIDRFFEPNKRAYQVQLRRKDPQGDWILKCDTIQGWLVPRPSFDEHLSILFTDLEPGTTYEARWRETNESSCSDNPPNPNEWSSIREGTTLLETPPRVEFADTTLAIAVRLTLGLDIIDGVDILKIPEEQLTQLTTLLSVRSELTRLYELSEELRPYRLSSEHLDLDLPVITDLTGLEHATQLRILYLYSEDISDVSPLARLTELTSLSLNGNRIGDISPLAELTGLEELYLEGNQVSDISPLTELTELRELELGERELELGEIVSGKNEIMDITPLAHLTQLTRLGLNGNRVTDITPLTQLTELTSLSLNGNRISDITPLAHLTELTSLGLSSNRVSDITPLAHLTELTSLGLNSNRISDITPLAHLTELRFLVLSSNRISDITPLAHLTELTALQLGWNQISDITPLAQLQKLTRLLLGNNRINDVTPLAQLSESLEELHLEDNLIRDVTPLANLIRLGSLYLSDNSIEDTSPLSALLDANPDIYIDIKVMKKIEKGLTITASAPQPLTAATLNGSVVKLTLSSGDFISGVSDELTISGITGVSVDRTNYAGEGKITVELKFEGNLEKDAILTFTLEADAIEGYDGPPLTAEISVSAGAEAVGTDALTTDAKLSISPASVASPTIGQQLEFNLNITGGETVAGYQATVQFDTTALRYISGVNGDYLPAGAFFVHPVVKGNLVKLNAASLAGETNGAGTLATLTFEVIAAKDPTLTLSDVLLTDNVGVAYVPKIENADIVESPQFKGDVNADGLVNIQDLVLVASNLDQTGQNAADANGDGVVNIVDLVLVAGALGTSAAAPSLHPHALEMLTATEVKQWLSETQQLDLTDTTAQRGILFLEQLLIKLTPKETALLANYPNPFNPETWIPYHLAKDADVTLHIYAVNGILVRTLTLGHQPAGMYQSRSRAAYWDGKNAFGESVASGVYFYTLTAGDFNATRKMLIRK